jgi:hypothetical protein
MVLNFWPENSGHCENRLKNRKKQKKTQENLKSAQFFVSNLASKKRKETKMLILREKRLQNLIDMFFFSVEGK